MAQVGIREHDAKKMIAKAISDYSKSKITYEGKVVLKTPENSFEDLTKENPWLKNTKLVVKPDQLFGKRGKHGLIGLNLDYDGVQKWIKEKSTQETKIDKASGSLTHFIIEPMIPHESEYYLSIQSDREGDTINFSYEGGIEIEENWDKVIQIKVPILENIENIDIASHLTKSENKDLLVNFIKALYKFYIDYNFAFLEINPFIIADGQIVPLDVVAKLDDTGAFESGHLWGNIEFPVPFGRSFTPEEQHIKDLDEKTGASLKLTVLNSEGKVWTMVAGGGASVIYADTVSDLGFGTDMANYGEYSGDPPMQETYEYAKTILDLATRKKDPKGKVMIIGGGIANFTDVAKTFAGIIKAITEYQKQIKENNIKIYVRRGGPNFEEGLKMMRELGDQLGVFIDVYGPETHMTEVVNLAVKNFK